MATDTGIPDRLLPAIRLAVFWIGLPFIGLLLGGERISEGRPYEAAAWLTVAILSIIVAVYWDRVISSVWPRYSHQQELQYLSERDPTLGGAIKAMARHSAWGRWYAAQHLVNAGSPISEQALLQIAASIITDKIVNGEIEVRGRRPGKMEYEPIPRTDWRSSGLSFVSDPISLWKLVIFPRGGAEISPDGTIARASNQAAAQRNSQIAEYDSLIVDAHQFERVWPKNDVLADRTRRRFLRRARKRKLDKAEIQRLSDPRRNVWPGLLIVAAAVLVFAYIAGPEIYRRAMIFMPHQAPTANGFTQEQVDAKIAAAVANLNAQLAEANRQRDAAIRDANALRQQIQNAPPPPTAAEGPRVSTDKTKEQIWDSYCEGRTELQCSILMNEEKNKWITIRADVAIIHAGGNMELSGGVMCNFGNQWLPALSTLRTGDHVTITGRIVGFNVRFFILQKCEIKSPS